MESDWMLGKFADKGDSILLVFVMYSYVIHHIR